MTTPADTPDMAIVNEHSDKMLDALDRCDRCGGQAYVQATMLNGHTVLFCAHHGRDAMPKLMEQALVVDDYTPYLEKQEDKARSV
jgi:hypothetical protein